MTRLLLAALALVAIVAAVKIRRVGEALSVESPDDIVGMPTYVVVAPQGVGIDWDAWFRAGYANNPDWRN